MWDVTAGRSLNPETSLTDTDGIEDEQQRIVHLHLNAKQDRLFVASADQNIVIYDFPSLKPEHQVDQLFEVDWS